MWFPARLVTSKGRNDTSIEIGKVSHDELPVQLYLCVCDREENYI